MIDQNLARGVFLAAIALFFGSNALRYNIGDFSRAGPGLFPLIVSILLLLLAVVTIVQSRLLKPVPLSFNAKNIAVIMAALGGFVLAAKYVSVILGIVLLVFVAGLAATSFSWKRNVQISVGLVVIAYLLQRLLGLNLKMF